MISIKFLLVISMLCKTEWSWELWTWSHKMNLLDISSTSPHYFCRKWIGPTNENSNFDLRILRVKRNFSLVWPIKILGWINHTNLIRNKSELRYIRAIMHNPSIIITEFTCNSMQAKMIITGIKIYLHVFIIILTLLLNQGLANDLRR